MEEVKKGDTVWVRKSYGHTTQRGLMPVVVKSVGKVWITVGIGNRDQRFDCKTLVAETAPYHLYLSKQDYHDGQERSALIHELESGFMRKATLDQLRAIKAIIEPAPTPQS